MIIVRSRVAVPDGGVKLVCYVYAVFIWTGLAVVNPVRLEPAMTWGQRQWLLGNPLVNVKMQNTSQKVTDGAQTVRRDHPYGLGSRVSIRLETEKNLGVEWSSSQGRVYTWLPECDP